MVPHFSDCSWFVAAMAAGPSVTAMEMAPLTLHYVMETSDAVEKRWKETHCLPADVDYADVDDAVKTGRAYWGLREARTRSNNEKQRQQ